MTREDVLRPLLAADIVDGCASVRIEHAETLLDDCIASLTETTHEDLTELVEFARESRHPPRGPHPGRTSARDERHGQRGLEQHHVGGAKALRAEIKRLPDQDSLRATSLAMVWLRWLQETWTA